MSMESQQNWAWAQPCSPLRRFPTTDIQRYLASDIGSNIAIAAHSLILHSFQHCCNCWDMDEMGQIARFWWKELAHVVLGPFLAGLLKILENGSLKVSLVLHRAYAKATRREEDISMMLALPYTDALGEQCKLFMWRLVSIYESKMLHYCYYY